MRSRLYQNRGVAIIGFCIGVLLTILYNSSFAEAKSASIEPINNNSTWLKLFDQLLTDDLFNITVEEHDRKELERSLDEFNITKIERDLETYLNQTGRSLEDIFNLTREERDLENNQTQTDRSLDDFFNITRQERDEHNHTIAGRSISDFFNLTRREQELENLLNQTKTYFTGLFNVSRRESDLENNQTQADRSLDDFFNITRQERDTEHNHTIASRSISDFFSLTRKEQELESVIQEIKTYFNVEYNVSRRERDLENNQTQADRSLDDFFNITRQERDTEHNHTIASRSISDSFNLTIKEEELETILKEIKSYFNVEYNVIRHDRNNNQTQVITSHYDLFNAPRIERDLESNSNQTDRSLDNFFNSTKQERDFESVANYNVTGELENASENTRPKRSTFYELFNVSRQDYNSKLYRNFNNLNRRERNADCNDTNKNNIHHQRDMNFSSNFNQTQDRSFNPLFNFSRPQPIESLFKNWFNLTRRERNVENNETDINQSRRYIFNFSSVERDEESNSTEQERDDEPVYRRPERPYSSNILNKSGLEPASGVNETHQRTWIKLFSFPRPHKHFTNWFNVPIDESKEEDVEDNVTEERSPITFISSSPQAIKDLLSKWFNVTRPERDVENNATQERTHSTFFNFSRPVAEFTKLSRQDRAAYIFPQYYATQNRSNIDNLFNQTHNNESDENKDSSYELSRYEADEPLSYNLSRQDRDIDLKPTFELSHYLHSHDFSDLQTGSTEVPLNPTPAYAAARNFFIRNTSTSESEIDSSEEQTANYDSLRT